MGVKELNLWNYATDTLIKLGKKNDLEALVRIVNKAASIYGTFEKMIPALSEIFLGIKESNPLTLLNATGADSYAGLGREAKDCAWNTGNGKFSDTGFNPDFRDYHNQIFHFWAYLATTASTDYPYGGYVAGYYSGQAGNFMHENLGVGDPSGASWQDFALAQAGLNVGMAVSFGLIKPGELGDYIQGQIGPQSAGAPYVNLLIRFLPLYGNRNP